MAAAGFAHAGAIIIPGELQMKKGQNSFTVTLTNNKPQDNQILLIGANNNTIFRYLPHNYAFSLYPLLVTKGTELGEPV